MKHLSHPLVGDVHYGKGDINRDFRARFGLHRLALHAASLALAHPMTGRALRVAAPIPQDMRGALDALGLTWPEGM
jgi:tRNA pseudouridine65 synthase